MMKIYKIDANERRLYRELMLMADEQEDMVESYIDKGEMYVLNDNGIKGECLVMDAEDRILEIRNIAVLPDYRGKGYGRKLIEFIVETYRDRYDILQAGTGNSPLTVPFYEKCGFSRSHAMKNFFLENYDHPIYENGVQLIDMIYFRRKMR